MIKRTYSRLNTSDESIFMPPLQGGSHLHQPDSPDFNNKKRRAAPWWRSFFFSSSSPSSSSSSSTSSSMVPIRRVVLWGLLVAAVCFGAVSSSRASSLTGMGGAHNILCEGLPPYVVFVDAGSTGCRAHTFKVVPGELPAFALRTMGKKVKGNTPLASLAGKTDEQITEALLPMLLKALEKVPEQHRGDTPLYVWATAGMRVLKDHQQDHLWAVRGSIHFVFETLHGKLAIRAMPSAAVPRALPSFPASPLHPNKI